jgi:predicted CXXCH cytochrome family protein
MRTVPTLIRTPGGPFTLGLAVLIVALAALPARRTIADEKPVPVIAPGLVDSYAGGLIGSKHDFSDGGRIPRDLCTACHTPHITNAQAPLLVRRPAATQPTRSYRTAVGDLSEVSLICLSCHDGTIAPDVYAGSHAIQWYDLSTGGVEPGKTRLTSHPIGVVYPPRNTETDYNSAAAAEQKGKVRFYDGRVQCTTCHDPHNTGRHQGMLRTSNERSRLCLACHRL